MAHAALLAFRDAERDAQFLLRKYRSALDAPDQKLVGPAPQGIRQAGRSIPASGRQGRGKPTDHTACAAAFPGSRHHGEPGRQSLSANLVLR